MKWTYIYFPFILLKNKIYSPLLLQFSNGNRNCNVDSNGNRNFNGNSNGNGKVRNSNGDSNGNRNSSSGGSNLPEL